MRIAFHYNKIAGNRPKESKNLIKGAVRTFGSGTVLNGVSFTMDGGPLWTVPELLFESKKLIPALQQLLIVQGN